MKLKFIKTEAAKFACEVFASTLRLRVAAVKK
jgi:hypothetical protein